MVERIGGGAKPDHLVAWPWGRCLFGDSRLSRKLKDDPIPLQPASRRPHGPQALHPVCHGIEEETHKATELGNSPTVSP